MSADATLDLATGYAALKRKVWAAMTSGQLTVAPWAVKGWSLTRGPFGLWATRNLGEDTMRVFLCLRRVEGRPSCGVISAVRESALATVLC